MKSETKIPYGSESYRKLNPHLFPVARRVRTKVTERNERGEGEVGGVETREEGIRYCVVFTVYRKRLLDEGDNCPSACKAIRDLLVKRIGLPNDSREHAEFEYFQIKSETIHGTHILIRQI